MGVFTRGTKLWIRFRDADGKWRSVPSHYVVGEDQLAQAMHDELVRRVDAATGVSKVDATPLTVRRYIAQWLEERRELGHDWQHDRSRLEHVMPTLGDLLLAEVRARHVIEAIRRVRTLPSKNTGEVLAQRTVYRIYEVLSRMFGDAKLADLIAQTPCELDERHLGPLVDADPEWRDRQQFTREEATALLSTPAIPFDRRMLYAFMLLAGMRPGEASALRWRHYDPTVQPLGRLVVAVAYDSRRHREKSTKTDATRYVPVHPALAAMLAEWKLGGWESMVGRAPDPDDLIIPLPPIAAAARRTRTGDPFRTEAYNGKRWREEDLVGLVALGWRPRELYSMKATFITLVLDDGADPHVIESRVTHTKRSRSAFDGYNRGRQWELTCAEVAKLRLARRVDEVAVPVAVGAPPDLVTMLVTATASIDEDSGSLLRRRGSKAGTPTLHVVGREVGREAFRSVEAGVRSVEAGDVSPSAAECRGDVTSRHIDADPIAADLEAALELRRAGASADELRRALLLVVMALSGCTAGQLRAVNRAGIALTTVTLACDWGQTRSAALERWNGQHESGPARVALGETPSTSSVDAYFALSAAAVLGLAHVVPERLRPLLYGAVVAGELATIRGNFATTSGACGL